MIATEVFAGWSGILGADMFANKTPGFIHGGLWAGHLEVIDIDYKKYTQRFVEITAAPFGDGFESGI